LKRPVAGFPGVLFFQMPRDELGDLEHRHGFLAVEDRLERFVSVDLGLFLRVLQFVFFMFTQTFFVSSVLGNGLEPTTAASLSSG